MLLKARTTDVERNMQNQHSHSGKLAYYLAPLQDGFAALGLVDKCNAPKTIPTVFCRRGHVILLPGIILPSS
ncbi:MAG: hypothetical protein ONB42_19935 [candidate division KSB1 bacterium]|nr:hypothetical protein [candidate division KSB1 bacterium]